MGIYGHIGSSNMLSTWPAGYQREGGGTTAFLLHSVRPNTSSSLSHAAPHPRLAALCLLEHAPRGCSSLDISASFRRVLLRRVANLDYIELPSMRLKSHLPQTADMHELYASCRVCCILGSRHNREASMILTTQLRHEIYPRICVPSR